jgi:predicted nucleic acid-binding protein
VTVLWDTTVASRLHPDHDLFGHVLDELAAGTPVRIAAPAILEMAYGYERRAARDRRYAALRAWFTHLIDSDTFVVVPLDGRAALVAGRLRAAIPHPPGKRDRRSKTMRQAAWLLDIEVAATAFTAGLDVATDNRADFDALATTLTDLYPTAPPLGVFDGPS